MQEQETVWIVYYQKDNDDSPSGSEQYIEVYSCEELARSRAKELNIGCFVMEKPIIFEY